MFTEFLETCRERYGAGDSSTSMAEWICQNTTLKKRPFSFTRYPFQRAIADDMHPALSVEKCSQVGLALALDTPLPTPTGWTTMDEVQVGDELFDEQGQPTIVEYVSPVYTDHACYRVTFDDGESIIADAGHRWYVEVDRPFDLSGKVTQGRPRAGTEMFHKGVLDTATIARFHKQGARNRFAIPNTQPLETPVTSLLVDPYFLGLWLGDGNTHACVLTTHVDDLPHYTKELCQRGMKVVPSSVHGDNHQVSVHLPEQRRPGRGTPNSISSRLNDLGLLGNTKHIPPQYLRASREARLDLLRGLLDTDGSITKNGRVSFYNTNLNLLEGARELARSLGYKTHFRARMVGPSTMKSGHVITPQHPVGEVSFVAYDTDKVFLLPRKANRLRPAGSGRPLEALRRRITGVEPVDPVPVRCLTVSSPRHLFLAGEGMIPTHNTEVQIRKFFAILTRNSAVNGIFTLPNEKMYKRIYSGRMAPILTTDAIFNPQMSTNPVRRNDLVQIRDSFGYITGCSEGDATSISADFLMHDELDLSPTDIIGLFPSRLQDSDMKITQQFSTPSFLDFGINRALNNSDQREYLCLCSACNHWNLPKFDFNFVHVPNLPDDLKLLTDLSIAQIADLDLGETYVKCEKCDRRLDLSESSKREWVARFPGKVNTRGYKVRPFTASRLSPAYILGRLSKARQDENIRGFHNTVLGEPFTESSAQIQRSDVEAVMAPTGNPPEMGSRPCYLGVDIGQTCHIVIITDSLTKQIGYDYVFFDTCHISQFRERLMDLTKRYNLLQGCADRFPYTPTVDALRDETNGLIVPVQYRGTANIGRVKDELGEVVHYSINRTTALDRVKTSIVEKSSVIAGYGPHRETIITHLGDMVRDERAEVEPEWKKLHGTDHFFHAAALALIAPRICEDMYANRLTQSGSLIMVQAANWMTAAPTLTPQHAKRNTGTLL